VQVAPEPVEKIPKTVATEPFTALHWSQERAIPVRMEELKAQGLETDGTNILLYWVRSAQDNLVH